MIRNRLLLKSFSVFLILETLFNIIAPSVSWALTAGPTAPEATSFEPVDTTDMVNLLTGDLAYNIPFLEVPGPSGGYPLSLSYHAGIQPNEEASWVGMGWTLNPGSIVRNVNGFADDQLNTPNSSRYFWKGGSTDTYSIGVSVGFAQSPASVSAGLSFSQDTYQGSGVGMYIGAGYMTASGVGIGARIGVNPYGDSYASAGINLSTPIGKAEDKAGSLSAGVGISTNFKSAGFYGSVSIDAQYENRGNRGSGSVLGATISTGSKGVSVSKSAVGASLTNNSASSYLSSSTKGFDVPIPAWYNVWINLGYSYQRYWIDQIDQATVNGALNYPDNTAELTPSYFDDKAFDTYSLLDPTLEGGVVDNPNPDKVLGGSFPGFDNYLVHAQGISGYMRPYYFQKHLYKRNTYSTNSGNDKEYQTIQYDLSKSNANEDNKRAEFRFVNDFSNRFEFTPGQINFDPSNPDQNPLLYNFSNGSETRVGEEASGNYTSNQVQGSSYINWFTNKEILTNAARVTSSGFIETMSTGFVRSTPDDKTDDDNIGGFVIVNQSGVKYHFALPAYSSNEYVFSGNKTGTETFNEFLKGGKYAYTWYLTGITGPDYVDRGPDGNADGKLNEFDWGYWVEFEYGKWTDQYAWRNPSEGMASDLDNNFQNFSAGVKEVYYLDAIRTKTHTALFFKDIRYDGKSALNLARNIDNRYSLVDIIDDNYTLNGRPPKLTNYTIVSHGTVNSNRREKVDKDIRIGGFIPKNENCECYKSFHHTYSHQSRGQTIEVYDEKFEDKGTGNYTPLPTSSLKLKSIVLIENSELASSGLSKLHGESYSQTSTISWQTTSDENNSLFEDQCDFSTRTINYHLYQNVLDVDDLNHSEVVKKSTRVIELDTDETLCPGTANSFDFKLLKGGSPSVVSSDYPRLGKLTLKGINFLGKGGVSLIPPIRFQYELNNALQGSGTLVSNNGNYSMDVTNSGLVVGDILKLTSNNNTYYVVVQQIDNSNHRLKVLRNEAPPTGIVYWQQTKNPPYDKDTYDSWGLYKSDFDVASFQGDERLARLVTEVSSKSLDVWSLRSVETAMGTTIQMEYESDEYAKPVLYQSNNLIVEKVEKTNDTNSKITLANSFPDIDKILKPNSDLSYMFLFADPYELWGGDYPTSASVDINMQKGSLHITSLYNENDKWIINTDSDLSNFFRIKPRAISGSFERIYLNPIFIAGTISLHDGSHNVGGGIRLKSIGVNSSDKLHKTIYHYNNPIMGNTSGVTTYEPGSMENYKFYFPAAGSEEDEFFNANSKEKIQKAYKKSLYENFEKLLSNSREVPSPGVLYEFVEVSESVVENGEEIANPNYTQYQFEVYKVDNVGIQYDQNQSTDFGSKRYSDFVNYSKKSARNVTLKDFTSRVGSLKSITLYNTDNQIISKTTNHYLHDEASDNSSYESSLSQRFNNQGVIEESFSDARFSSRKDTDFELQGILTKREQYPVIQIGQTTTNYKTGVTTNTTTLAFDYYSGQAIKSVAKDGHGNVYLSESTPAYKKYPGMGLATSGGKNMLTQEAAMYTYKVKPTNTNEKMALVSGAIQTWSDQIPFLNPDDLYQGNKQTGIWRKHASYSFIGEETIAWRADGLYSADNVTAFNAWTITDATPAGWQKNNEITLYDVQSHALEAADINNNYVATRMTSDQSRVLSTVANARYNEFANSGAEDFNSKGYSGNAVYVGSGSVSAQYAHTGKYSLAIGYKKSGFHSSIRVQNKNYDRKIRVSFWAHKSTAQRINMSYMFTAGFGTTIEPEIITIDLTKARKAGDWILCQADIPVDRNTIASRNNLVTEIINEGTSIIYVDDFRVHPVDAPVTSYVYNAWGELSHMLDNSNLYTEYRYDAMGRLTSTFKESFQQQYGDQGIVKVNEVTYNYGVANPYTLSLSASATGARGYIYPSGNISVAQGREQRFEMRSKCSYNTLSKVVIDGKAIDLDKSSVTLVDGTQVLIQRSGNSRTIVFKDVQSPHSIRGEFTSNSIAGVVECNSSIGNNGNTCYDGGYKYAYYDACGNLGEWTEVSRKTQIPDDLRGLASNNCCTLNTGSSATNCFCKPGSTQTTNPD